MQAYFASRKQTIESTGGYRKNLLHVDQVVLALVHFNGKWGKKILRGRTRDRPPLHPARFRAADLRSRFYFVDKHSIFDSNQATQHAPYGDQFRLVALLMRAPHAHFDPFVVYDL